MEIDKLRQEFNQLLENINRHSERFTSKSHVPSLEMSVVMAKLNKMQETAAILKYLLEEQEDFSKKKKSANDNQNKPTTPIHIIEEEVKQTIEETITEKEDSVPEETIPDIEISLQQPVSKLADAFSLNDRYLYANELFDKSMESFTNTIKLLDECSGKENATETINKLIEQYSWSDDNEFVQSFIATIDRKFI